MVATRRVQGKWRYLIGLMVVIALVAAACGDDTATTTTTTVAATTTTAAGTTTTAADTTTTAAAAPTHVRVAMAGGFGTLPVWIAKEKGFFADEGLDVEITVSLDLASFIPGLGRQYDVVHSTAADFLNARAQGIDVVVLAGQERVNPGFNWNLIARNGSGITTPEDLSGKTLGVVTLAGTIYASTQYLLQTRGIENVNIVQVPFPNMADQLDAGLVDAVIGAQPFTAAMEAAGHTSILDIAVEAGGDNAVISFNTTSQAWADANPDAVAAWRRAVARADEFITTDETEARTIAMEWLGLPEAVAMNTPLQPFSTEISDSDFVQWIHVMETIGALEPGQVTADGLVLP